jgi:hypothetical protein
VTVHISRSEGKVCRQVREVWSLSDYFFTLPTLRRLIASEELGSFGQFLPIWWADREANLTTAEKAELQPYGIVCLFRRG